jgi:hypothetical protein
MVLLVVLLTLALRSLAPADNQPADSPLPNCDHYASQAEAQATYRGDPTGLIALDGDRDGLACERLGAPYDATPVRWEVGP